jgi:hypothetical protein
MTTNAELAARYQHWREVLIRVNSSLVKTLEKGVMDEGGDKLGIRHKGVLVFDREEEMPILMDYCVHDIRRDGLNAVERMLKESPPPEDSEEMTALQALRKARFILFVAESLEPGVGVHGRDVLRDEPVFLIDLSFSQHGAPGMILPARVIDLDGLTMTTGAPLPATLLPPTESNQYVQRVRAVMGDVDFHQLSSEDASTLATEFIRSTLRTGAARDVDTSQSWRGGRLGPRPGAVFEPQALAQRRHVGRNDPCPCGSGKKFKHCCLKRQ